MSYNEKVVKYIVPKDKIGKRSLDRVLTGIRRAL